MALQSKQNVDYTGFDELKSIEQSLDNYNQSIVAFIASSLNGCKNVAEFGAGIGTISKLFEDKTAIKPACVEIDPQQIAILSERGFSVQTSICHFKDMFDGIFSSNVLEHIDNDVETLKQLHSKLKPGGTLALYLPAFMSLYSGLDEAVGHYRRYEKKEIISKLQSAGFTVRKAHYADTVGYFASIALKLLGYNKSNGLGSEKSFKLYDTYIFPLSQMMDTIGFKYLLGKNIFVEAVK